jgi:hypothetical protein
MDLNKFLNVINSSDNLTVILKGHLFIEAKIIELIKVKLAYPDALDFSRINFPLKLSFCVSLGLMDEVELPPFLKLNKMRNDSAHKLTFELEPRDIDNFISTLNGKQMAMSNFEDDDDIYFKFRKVIAALYLILDNRIDTFTSKKSR